MNARASLHDLCLVPSRATLHLIGNRYLKEMNDSQPTGNLVQLWPLLFPFSYALHLAEEYWGGNGFAEWFSRVLGADISVREFLLINSIIWPLMFLAALQSIRDERFAWVTVSLATIVLLNGAVHLLSSVLTGTYSPGVFTGVFLYIPLGAYGFRRQRRTVVGSRFWRAVGFGLLLHAVVAVVAYW